MLAGMTVLAAAAAEAATEAATQAAAHSGGGGLPQLDAHTFAPQLFWLVLTFVALYFILSKVALPRIGEVLEERADRIARDLGAAQRLKDDTDKALADYEKALADARHSGQEPGLEPDAKSQVTLFYENGRPTRATSICSMSQVPRAPRRMRECIDGSGWFHSAQGAGAGADAAAQPALRARWMAAMPPVRLVMVHRSQPLASMIPLSAHWSGHSRIDSARYT